MLSLSAALATAVAQPPAAQFVDLFVSACMNGTVKLDKDSVRAVTHKELPPVLRHQYKPWPGAAFYELSKPARGDLLIMRDETRRKRGGLYEVCTVAAPGLPYEAGYDHVRKLLPTPVRPREAGKKALLEFYDAEAGIVLSARSHPSGWGSLKLARPSADFTPLKGGHPLVHIEQASKKN